MMRAVQHSTLEVHVRKLVFWYAFLMAFPAILIIQNLSIYLFPFIILGMYSLSGRFFSFRYGIQFIALAFGAGAILSVINIPVSMPFGSLNRALEVLPNYLYWVLLILMLTSYKELICLGVIYRGIVWGIFFSVVYYFWLQDILTLVPIFKVFSQNNFAFLLICYTPIVVWYTWYRFGFWSALLVLMILTLIGFLSGSRSGSLLTLSGGTLTLLLNRRSTGGMYVLAVSVFLILISMSRSKLIKDIVVNLNPRTYELIYNSQETLEEDRSYLARLAQIEKAVIIYDKYPLTGIGLNNFIKYKVKLPGNFEGANYVVDKKNIDEISAHNSYFGFLAEGGLLLTVPFILLLSYCVIWFLMNSSNLKLEYRPIFIGIIHMSVHLYFIYAIVNVFAWFLIGLGCLIIVRSKK